MKNTVKTFKEAKAQGKKLSMVTAYDYSMAKIIDQTGINAILVGDSLGMVSLGYDDTLPVTMDDMVHHTKAVTRGAKNPLVVADMSFMSYHISREETLRNAGRLIKEGQADAVKLEGGREFIEDIKALGRAQIPVMGHLGLTPQSVNMLGGFKVQGKSSQQIEKLIDDALALEEAGVFAIVLECIPEKIAEIITSRLTIPTIGIGAGKYCDGQILVINDMLGMFPDFTPKFVKKYRDLHLEITGALEEYIDDIDKASFPAKEHSFKINEEVLKDFQ